MTANVPIKALVLAAGYGNRLRPLTDHVPKPLLPFFGQPLLAWALAAVRHAGIKDLAVNGHHLADQIKAFLDAQGNKGVLFSHEYPEILGTGGAITALRPWHRDSHLLLYNADIIANFNLKALIDQHLSTNALATMCLLPNCPPGKNPVHADQKQVVAIGELTEQRANISAHTLACAHIISPRFLNYLPQKPTFHDIILSYKDALTNQEVISYTIHHGMWFDLGTPHDLWLAYRHILQQANPQRCLDELTERHGMKAPHGLLFHSLPQGGANAAWRHNTMPPPGCRNVVNLSEHSIPQNYCWQDVLVLPGACLPTADDLRGVIVSTRDLVYTDV